MKILPTVFILISTFIIPGILGAQDTIYLKNSSFEDTPRKGDYLSLQIRGWTDCGFPGESPVDIHPIPGEKWSVGLKAEDGQTYLGIVARSNATWEAVAQKLCRSLEANHCYLFKASLAFFDANKSRAKKTLKNQEDPLKSLVLQIWGGSDECNRGQLLARSLPINNTTWKEFSFLFKPNSHWEYILLEAFYYFPSTVKEEDQVAYNGHILVDHLSPIIEIECLK